GDFAFELIVNTSASEITIGERTLPAGPLAAVKSTGTLAVGGFDFAGEFFFSASVAGVSIAMDAEVAATLNDSLTLFRFDATGALAVDGDGIYAAMDLTLVSALWSQ